MSGNAIQFGNVAYTTGTTGCVVKNCYFQTSKTPILVVGSYVTNDLEITSNSFITVTGSPTYAVNVPGVTFVPNCHSNAGSQSDINRAFTPTWFVGATLQTPSVATGRLVRIGNRVNGELLLTLTSFSGSGTVTLQGLPIAANSNTIMSGGLVLNYSGFQSISTGGLWTRISASSTALNLSYGGAASTGDVTSTNMTATASLYANFSYEV